LDIGNWKLNSLLKYNSLLIAALLVANAGFAQSFTARADKTEVPLDGSFRITYTMENMQGKNFSPPDFSPFNAYGPNQSTNMSFINGQTSRTVTYTYTLQPTEEGEFEIGPATFSVKGKIKKTNPVNIRVLAAGSSSTSNTDSGRDSGDDDIRAQIRDNLFLRVIPGKTKVFEGEQVTLTYKLYQALSLDDIQIRKMPNYDSFLSYDIELSDKQREFSVESYNGRNYNVRTIHQVALFPSKSGSLTIEPMEMTSRVLIQKRDPRFLFPRTERVEYDFKSNSITVEVSPLPLEGRPADFTGAVGQFDFDVTYDKTKTQVDDPVTLRVKISGNGNIKLIDLPDPGFPQSFEVYDPKIKENISKRSYTVNGSKSWEYLIIPRGGGSFQLPDLSFSYFDVNKAKYVRLERPGQLIEVEGAALSPQDYPGGGFSKEEVELLGEDIRFIKTGKLSAASASTNLLTRPVFHLLTWLPLILSAFIPFIYRSRKKRYADVAATRSRKARREASKRMEAARKLMQTGDEKAFYNEVVKSIWGYVADKFNIPAAELSRENTMSVLDDHGVSATLSAAVNELIGTCEMAVYAPSAVHEGMEGIAAKATELIQQLDKEINA
jgi:hypothetical protein